MGVRCEYEKISVSPDGFDGAVRRLLGDFDGFNITIPYKRDIMEYLNGVEGDAFDFGAVNTVVTATRKGYNTDGVGFLLMLETAGIEVKDKKILVLGAGGSGRSSAAALKKAGADVFLYRRNRERLQEICAQLSVAAADDPESGGFDILVNCTGVGMHDTEGCSPVTAKAFAGATAAIDLIYRPEKSEFLRLAEKDGLQILSGAAMLFYQAYFADCLYLNREPDKAEAERLYEKYLAEQA
ncbi:MAG: shikimate dehydrogenase [Clostridia bacterium]|nr:shikimate dehydrogenase [Clostridia bacterium]